jgi:uncharacterized Zn-binding protein involved in type VI secretion
MPGVARKGLDVANSTILTGRMSVIANNQPIACEGDVITPHVPGGPHSSSTIIGYTPKVVAEDQNVARLADGTSCGHPIQTGSDDVFAG